MSRVPDRIPPGPIKLTYEDYVGLPDDGRRYEILDGELEVSPAPAPRHQGVSRNLLWVLHGHVRERGLGSVYCAPIDVILAPTSVVQPDLIFIGGGRESIITARAIEGRRTSLSRSSPLGPIDEIASRRPRSTLATASTSTGSSIPRSAFSRCTTSRVQGTGSSGSMKAGRECGPRSSPISRSTSVASGSEPTRLLRRPVGAVVRLDDHLPPQYAGVRSKR